MLDGKLEKEAERLERRQAEIQTHTDAAMPDLPIVAHSLSPKRHVVPEHSHKRWWKKWPTEGSEEESEESEENQPRGSSSPEFRLSAVCYSTKELRWSTTQLGAQCEYSAVFIIFRLTAKSAYHLQAISHALLRFSDSSANFLLGAELPRHFPFTHFVFRTSLTYSVLAMWYRGTDSGKIAPKV